MTETRAQYKGYGIEVEPVATKRAALYARFRYVVVTPDQKAWACPATHTGEPEALAAGMRAVDDLLNEAKAEAEAAKEVA